MLKIAQRKTDDGDNVLADIEAGATSALYVTPGLDQNLSITQNGATYYYSQDGLNSVRTLTDSTGVMVNKYDYLPFGGAYAPKTTTTINQRYTYTGRETNAVAKSMYYRNRNYATSIGRFNRRDPIGYAGGVNLYSYVGERPIMAIDPMGLMVAGVARDLDGWAWGNHGFIWIDPDDPKLTSCCCSHGKINLPNDGPGINGFTLGVFKCKDGNLETRTNDTNDVDAIRDYEDNIPIGGETVRYGSPGGLQGIYTRSIYRKKRRDSVFSWDPEITRVNKGKKKISDSKLICKIFCSFDALKLNLKKHPIDYKLFCVNCHTGVNTLMKDSGISDAERRDVGDQWGTEMGEQNFLPPGITSAGYVPPSSAPRSNYSGGNSHTQRYIRLIRYGISY